MLTPLGSRRRGFTLIELLVVIAIIAILIALLVPAVQKARESAARTQCTNNLKQLGLGLHNFHDVNKGFPPALQNTAGGVTRPENGWTYYVLPYIEMEPLFKRIQFNVDWDNPAVNDADPDGVNQQFITIFVCPSAPSGREASRHRKILDYPAITQITRPNPYATNLPPSDSTYIGVLGHNIRRRLTDITDGTSNTLLLAESAGRNQLWRMGKFISASGTTGAWANPSTQIVVSGFNPPTATIPGACAVNCTNANEVYSFHTSGAMGLFADGSVRMLSSSMSINTLIAITTRCIGEVVNPD
jgi:prepilin-type N-terminal cleavage/methylation domain-containing protein/prepilin-type processing-associated H-X9-DG protein